MKRLLAFILTIAAVLSTVELESTAAGLQEKVLRLHILAASDSEEDQRLKLQARDGIMAYLAPLLADCEGRADAVGIAEENLQTIAQIAADTTGQRACAAIVKENFTAREYEGFALPAGEYTSLRIELGEGAGRNWWCVVFPPLCAALAEGDEDAFALFGDREMRLITGSGRIIRFRIVEWLSTLKKALI